MSSTTKSATNLRGTLIEMKGLLGQYKSMPPLVLGVLQQLDGYDLISYMLLKETGIGKAVNGFRKAEGDVGALAKKLVSKWKDLASEAIKSQDNQKLPSSDDQQSRDSTAINKKLSERYSATTGITEVKIKVEKPESAGVKIKTEQPELPVVKQGIASQEKSEGGVVKEAPDTAESSTSKIKKDKLKSSHSAVTNASSANKKTVEVKGEKVEDSTATSIEKTATAKNAQIEKMKVDSSANDSATVETTSIYPELVKVKKEKSDKCRTTSAEGTSGSSQESEKKTTKLVNSAATCSDISKSDTVTKSFEDALLGQSKKKHKKSKSKQSSSKVKNDAHDEPKSYLPKRKSPDLSSDHTPPDSGEDLAKLHESISFSNLLNEPAPIKASAVKEPPIKKIKADEKNNSKKTIGLSEYKLLSSIKKEKTSDAKELKAGNQQHMDEKTKSAKVVSKKRLSEDEIEAAQQKVSKLEGLQDEGNVNRDVEDDPDISPMSKLQSDLNHFMTVVQEKQSAPTQPPGAYTLAEPTEKDMQTAAHDTNYSHSKSSSKSSVLSPECDAKSSRTSSEIPKAYKTYTNCDTKSHTSSKHDSHRRSSHSSKNRHKSSDSHKSAKDSDREPSTHRSDRHRSKSSTEKRRSSEKTSERASDHSREKSSSKNKSSSKDYDRHKSVKSSKSHDYSEVQEFSPNDDILTREATSVDDYSYKHKSHTQTHKKHSSSHYEAEKSSRSSSDQHKSKKSHRHASGSSSGSSSHHRSSSTDRHKDKYKSEAGSSSREKDRKNADEKSKSVSSRDKHNHSSSSHNHHSSDKKSKHKSSSSSSHKSRSDSHKSNSESHRDETHKHSKEKSHKRKRKGSEGGADGTDGQTFEALMTSSYKDVPKKKKPQSLEQKIAKTVAEKPLPQSYLDDLPELLTDYRPLPKVNLSSGSRHDKSAESTSALAFSDIKASSRAESIYSGKRRGYASMLSLADLCLHVLGNNIDDIGYVGGVPYDLLEPVLKKATPRQLLTVEDYNTDFTQESDPLWKEHCARDFKGHKPDEFESWRELYLRKYEEREKKLEMLQSKISAKEQQKSSEARKSQVAYAMASAPKPPREVRRQQAKYGTGSGSMESTARAAAIQKQEQSLRPYVSKGSGSGGGSREPRTPVKVISIPPLMKKAKKFFNKLQR